jgi:hypothetical protein
MGTARNDRGSGDKEMIFREDNKQQHITEHTAKCKRNDKQNNGKWGLND